MLQPEIKCIDPLRGSSHTVQAEYLNPIKSIVMDLQDIFVKSTQTGSKVCDVTNNLNVTFGPRVRFQSFSHDTTSSNV